MLVTIQKKYAEILSNYDFSTIQKALDILKIKKENLHVNKKNLSKETELFDKDTQSVFELMADYEQDIREIFICNNESLTHITDISPENMIGGKIQTSKNRLNNYETERGNWVFASSSPMDGKNPYIARSPKTGMVRLDNNTYIYNCNNFEVQFNEQGESKVLLKKPNYVYEINPEKFKPVVTLKRDENGKPFFEFSEEWISEEDVDIGDSSQVLNVEKITDITEVVKNHQIMCDVNETGVAEKIVNTSSKEDGLQKLFSCLTNGDLRYINRRGLYK